jgi:DRTGG domain.
MKISELIKKLNAIVVNLPDGYDREITGGYCGDFLSFVMNRAPEGAAWFTVMTNVNVAAVAALSDVACTVICEGSVCDDALIQKAVSQGLCVLSTDLTVFDAVKAYLGK